MNIAQSNCVGISISEILVTGPYGLQSTQAEQVPGMANQAFTNITWDSTGYYTNVTMICTLAIDSNDASSVLSCVTVLIDFEFPVVLNNTLAPTGTLQINFIGETITFRSSFNLHIIRPNFQTFINIFYSNGIKLISFDCSNSSQVSYSTYGVLFKLPTKNLQRSSYYITFDEGVGVIYNIMKTGCDIRSNAIKSTKFWTFKITKPIASMCNYSSLMFLILFYLFIFLCLHYATLVIATAVFLKVFNQIHLMK